MGGRIVYRLVDSAEMMFQRHLTQEWFLGVEGKTLKSLSYIVTMWCWNNWTLTRKQNDTYVWFNFNLEDLYKIIQHLIMYVMIASQWNGQLEISKWLFYNIGYKKTTSQKTLVKYFTLKIDFQNCNTNPIKHWKRCILLTPLNWKWSIRECFQFSLITCMHTIL